ncbi:hypothetical protein GHK92_07850 [Nocardioides sp. dk4132]|uniref:hypothetical protein n=1 Tax=unclassified Nocardioides TaxID=2615069 RepID=UPI0012958C6D|nr:MULTISPECIES: hypothetical protein [unclassified Nocardioides]MQW75783.1 hypothetical protein [Nocardioides sp. dk4132]QGA08663.1 hypothetical protein GFH29_15600 [Nocardioides sp. dk884]
MSDPADRISLHDALHRASDAIEAPGMAGAALAEARRRGARRRGVASALAAAAAVVVVVVSVQVATDDPRAENSPHRPTSPTTGAAATAPPVPRSRVQELWDPRGAGALPALDLGTPHALPAAPTAPGPIAEAVALLDDDARPLLVAADGTAVELDLPADLGRWRSLALSPDGRRVAALGRAVFVRDLTERSWQRIERPRGIDVEAHVRWFSDDVLALESYRGTVRLDLRTGEQQALPFARSTSSWAPAPGDDSYVAHTLSGVHALRELRGAEEVARTHLGQIGSLQRFVVSDDAIAAARGNTTFPPTAPQDRDRDGLIAVDRGTLETRALLPVPYESSWYSDGGNLSPLLWLNDDTVLFVVQAPDAPSEYLLAWDVETGDLARVTEWPAAYVVTFAVDLLTAADDD